MSIAGDPSSSYEGPSAAHRLSFSGKKKEGQLQYTEAVNYRIIRNLRKMN